MKIIPILAKAFLVCATGVLMRPGALARANAAPSCSELSKMLTESVEDPDYAALETPDECLASIRIGDLPWWQRDRLGYPLAIIGGPDAVRLLRTLYSQEPNAHARALLCTAMASTGSEQDIRYLLDSIRWEDVGGIGSQIESAALSLSLLRPAQALAELKTAAATPSLSWGVNHALKVIKEGELITPQAGSLSVEDEIVLAVLRTNPPLTTKNTLLRDVKRQRVYRRSGKSWYLKESRIWGAGDWTRATFLVRLSTDSSRALVYCSFWNEGYTYVLRRQGNAWHVRALLAGSVS